MKKIFSVMGIIAGTIFLIAGIYLLVESPQHYHYVEPRDVEFGGDFYTYEYEATRYAASNISELGENMAEKDAILFVSLGLSFLALGLATIAYFGSQLIELKKIGTTVKIPDEINRDFDISDELPEL